MIEEHSTSAVALVQEVGGLAWFVLLIAVSAALWQLRPKLLKRPWLLHVMGLVLVGFGYSFSTYSFGLTGTMVISGGIFGLGVSLLAASFTLSPSPSDRSSRPSPIEVLLQDVIRDIQEELRELDGRPMAPLHRQLKADESNQKLSEALRLLVHETIERKRTDRN